MSCQSLRKRRQRPRYAFASRRFHDASRVWARCLITAATASSVLSSDILAFMRNASARSIMSRNSVGWASLISPNVMVKSVWRRSRAGKCVRRLPGRFRSIMPPSGVVMSTRGK